MRFFINLLLVIGIFLVIFGVILPKLGIGG